MKFKFSFWTRYKKWFPYLLGGVFAVGILATVIAKRREHFTPECMQIEREWIKRSSLLTPRSEMVKKVEEFLSHYPELTPKYEPKLGQALLIANEWKGAHPYIERTLKRTHLHPYYANYTKTSLLIAKKSYEKALEEAVHLKKNILLDKEFLSHIKGDRGIGSGLFAFNLLRIVTLCELLGDSEKEKQACEDFEMYWKDKEFSREGFKKLVAHLKVGEKTILDYIASRKEELS